MPPHLKRSINQAYLENGTFEHIVRHLEKGMNLNGLESDETGVKSLMTITKKNRRQSSSTKKQHPKRKKQNPETVPNNAHQDDQCHYCKDTEPRAIDCPKLAKRRQFEIRKIQKIQMLPDIRIVMHQDTKNHLDTL